MAAGPGLGWRGLPLSLETQLSNATLDTFEKPSHALEQGSLILAVIQVPPPKKEDQFSVLFYQVR